MRLRVRLVGTARGHKEFPQPACGECPIEPAPALSGGDCKAMATRAQPREERLDAFEQAHVILACEEMGPVAIHEGHRLIGTQIRRRQAERVAQPETNDMARLLHRRDRQAQIMRRRLDARDDGRGGIDQGAVPIEHDQRVARLRHRRLTRA